MVTVYFFYTRFVFFYMIVASPIVLSFFLRSSFSRLLSTSRELFLILVLKPVGTFVENKAQEVRFAALACPFYSYLVQCAHLCPYFFQRLFLQKVVDGAPMMGT